jgi:DNA-binding response OmpR family regulator
MKPNPQHTAPAASQTRILVCDDAATVRALMAALLGRNYTLLLTASAEEALDRAPAFSPDLVITDLMLPGLSGRELILRLRAIPAFEEVPMILLTAVGESEARAEGLEAGADDYLVKPIRQRELLARVASLLRLRHTLLALSLRSRELEDANSALRAAQDRLLRTERLAALGSLAAALAHDINNPLSLVTSGASTLVSIAEDAMRLAGPIDAERFATLMAELHDIALEIVEGSRRLQGVGRDLRLFGAGDGVPASRVRAEDAVRSAVSLATTRPRGGPAAPVEVVVVDSPEIEAPAHLVALALLSVLERALLAAGPGGHVRVDVRLSAGNAEIAVSDDGAAIPTELLPRVFEPFVRLHPTHQAAGLGLAVAAGIVQGLGGHIDVDGSLKSGACFRVLLPVATS